MEKFAVYVPRLVKKEDNFTPDIAPASAAVKPWLSAWHLRRWIVTLS
jgi:hypothetical protein